MASDSEQVRRSYAFSCRRSGDMIVGGEWYQLQVKVIKRGEVFFGLDWEARVIERMCRLEYERRVSGTNTVT